MRTTPCKHGRAARGIAVLAVLLVMLVVSALSVAGVRATVLAARLDGQVQQRAQALAFAGLALADAERDIEGGLASDSPRAQALAAGTSAAFSASCAGSGAFHGLCQAGPAPAGMAPLLATDSAVAVPYGQWTGARLPALASNGPRGPHYLIELLESAEGAALYRITAEGSSGSVQSAVALQALYRKPIEARGRRIGWRELGNWQQLLAPGGA